MLQPDLLGSSRMSINRAARGYGEIDAKSASIESQLQLLGRCSATGGSHETGETHNYWISTQEDKAIDPSRTTDAGY